MPARARIAQIMVVARRVFCFLGSVTDCCDAVSELFVDVWLAGSFVTNVPVGVDGFGDPVLSCSIIYLF